MLKKNYSVIALMSGTSLDGIDIIHVTFQFEDIWKFKIHESKTLVYPKRWKHLLKDLTQHTVDYLKEIDEDYSVYLADKIRIFININAITEIDFISSHGHTALHKPSEGLTYQIGNRQVLADILNQKVICDFRVQDVQLGGQGAPLVPIGDRLLFSEYTYCLNLGGFANISFEEKNSRIAYDICPVNIVLNYYVSKLGLAYDDKGKIARTGQINNSLLSSLNSISFYYKNPPKSLGLEWVEENIFPLIENHRLEIKDILRTVVEHVAIQIAHQLKTNSTTLITGGGAYNEFLIERISCHSNTSIVIPSEELIEFKEALIFGLLGVLKSREEINCLSSVTGAAHDHSSGKIMQPKNNI